MSSFMCDDRGVTEPYTDLPALGLVAVGILFFGYLLCSAYSGYAAKASYVDLKDDLRTMAIAMAADPAITCDGSAAVLDARKLDNLSASDDFIHKYGRPGDEVAIEVMADHLTWRSGGSGKIAAGYLLPVTVRLNDARCLSGTLTVSLMEGK